MGWRTGDQLLLQYNNNTEAVNMLIQRKMQSGAAVSSETTRTFRRTAG